MMEKLVEWEETHGDIPHAIFLDLIEQGMEPDSVILLGVADSWRDLALQLCDDGIYGEIPEHLSMYLDYDKMARDLQYSGCQEIRTSWSEAYYWEFV